MSIVLVVLSHFGWKMIPGLFGVTIFFFVSGFLITGHLLGEVDGRGAIDLPRFYLRRILRLYPALIVAVVAASAMVTTLGGSVAVADVASALFYAINLREYAQLLPEPIPGMPHPFGVLWSLAVEEHYYLLFPLLTLVLARRRTTFIAGLVAIIVLVTAWRVHMADICAEPGACTFLRIEHGTDTRIDSIVYGALLAAVLASPMRPAVLRLAASPAAAWLALALLAAAVAVRAPWFRDTLRFSVQGVGLFLGIAALLFSPHAARWRAVLARPVLTAVGRWSYSLYLWHWIVLAGFMALAAPEWRMPLERLGIPPAWWLATAFPALCLLSLACAALSYAGVERPMVRLRRRFGSNAVG